MPLTSNLETIGSRLRLRRKLCGLTQGQTAQAAGLSERAYAKIERGESDMRIVTAVRICEALHVTLDDVFFEENTEQEKAGIRERLEDLSPSEMKKLNLLVGLVLAPER